MMGLLPFEYAARNAARHPLRAFLTASAAAAVVFLVILMGSFVHSLGESLRQTGHPLNLIILGVGSEDFLEQSEISAAVPSILAASLKGVKRHFGSPMISPEIHHATIARPANDPSPPAANPSKGLFRGVTPMAFVVHPQVFIAEGRAPEPGEALVGRLAPTKLGMPAEALKPGREIWFEGRNWKVSGTFEAPGTAYEAEVWVPLEDLKSQVKRSTITCAVARVESPEDFARAAVFCKTRLDLELAAVTEARYYARLGMFFRPIRAVGWMMAVIVVAAGLFGALNTMIASVSARAPEFAALETIGYGRGAIAFSLFTEFLLEAAAGALAAWAIGVLVLSGMSVRFTMGAVSLQVHGWVLGVGAAAALSLAVAGTVAAVLRIAGKPIVELLRS
jgi:putative ABC transport system permease protein